MRRSVAVIHTTPVTIEPLKALIAESLDVEVINFVDASILPQLQRTEGDLSSVARRLLQYAKVAQELGVQAVLNACSSVGPLVTELRAAVGIPVIRIDEAMARSMHFMRDFLKSSMQNPTSFLSWSIRWQQMSSVRSVIQPYRLHTLTGCYPGTPYGHVSLHKESVQVAEASRDST